MIKPYNDILKLMKNGKTALLETSFQKEAGNIKTGLIRALKEIDSPNFFDTYSPEPNIDLSCAYIPKDRLILLGGGHIAQPVTEFATRCGFDVTVADDRETFANGKRFPLASHTVCGEFGQSIKNLSITANDYAAVITRGHKQDELCLHTLLAGETWPAYVGLIGSKKRVSKLKEQFIMEGFSKQKVNQIHTPIGLSIDAETPEEIAVSIVAELIQVKRARNPVQSHIQTVLNYDTLDFLEQMDKIKEPFAVATIISTKGSTPRKAGSMMAVRKDGSIIGSVGGGYGEGVIIQKACELIGTDTFQLVTLDMDNDFEDENGMVCGGTMQVLIEG